MDNGYTYIEGEFNQGKITCRYYVTYENTVGWVWSFYSNTLPPQKPKVDDLWEISTGWLFWNGDSWARCQSYNEAYRELMGDSKLFELIARYGDIDEKAQKHETVRALRDQLLMALKLIEPDPQS